MTQNKNKDSLFQGGFMNRKRSASLLLLLTVSVLLSASGIAAAEPQLLLPDRSTVALNSSSTVLVALNEKAPGIYTAEYPYAGSYDRTRIYRRYHGATLWRTGGKPSLLANVTCGSARGKLARYGIWSGALQEDGACWNSEPQDYATGNYLNYLVSQPAK
jgi:hypothetical protein